MDAPTEGTIRYRLRNLDLDKVQHSLNEKLKIHTVKTVPNRPYSMLLIYFTSPIMEKNKILVTRLKLNLNRELADFCLCNNIFNIRGWDTVKKWSFLRKIRHF